MALHKTEEQLVDMLKEPINYIPLGIYCYGAYGNCPFWDYDDERDYQDNGYCHYLGRGDWDGGGDGFFTLLWDQCKECDVNDIDEEFW